MSKQNPRFMRQIKSFVKREGRLTVGQEKALAQLWPVYGLEVSQGLIDSQNAVLEIGFGNGKSLVTMAATAPEQAFIGIEVHRPGVGALLMGLQEHDATNVRVYQEDGLEVLEHCIKDNSLARVQLFFPDPWPKKKHHKRRIVQQRFLDLVGQKLQPGGILHMATDWYPYAEHMLEFMRDQPLFKNCAGVNNYSDKPAYRPTTKFEVRGQKLGHGVWDLLYKKIEN
jgi:tRNA (guanine-N7-)-methyltransferase